MIVLINYFFNNTCRSDFKTQPATKHTRCSTIKTLSDPPQGSEKISALLEFKSLDENISLYQKIVKFYTNNQSRQEKYPEVIDSLLKDIKESKFEPILEQKYACNFVADLYYKKAVYFQNLSPKPQDNLKECINLFKQALEEYKDQRIIHYYPDSIQNNITINISYSPEIMAHKNLYEIYFQNSFHQECKDYIDGECKPCLANANYHGMQYLKNSYFSIKKFKFNGAVINPHDLSLVKFDQFYKNCEDSSGISLPDIFVPAINTIRLMKESLTVFNEFQNTTHHDQVRAILSLHAKVFQIEIYRFYKLALQCNYLPAFFELERFLDNYKLKLNYDDHVLNNNLYFPLDESPKTPDGYPVQKLIMFANILKENQIGFFSSKFTKNQNIKFLDDLEVDSTTEVKPFLNCVHTIKESGESINAIYAKMPELEKRELHQIKSQTTIFKSDDKPNTTYLLWPKEAEEIKLELRRTRSKFPK